MTEHIIRAYREGQSLRQIAAALGVTATTVHRILCRYGEPRRGVGYQQRPPTPAQLERDRAVIRSYQSGQSMNVISRQLGISTSVVWRVLTRHNEPRHARVRRQQQ
jgi:transposase